MPDVTGALREGNALCFRGVIGAGEEADLHRRCMLGEEGEIDALTIPLGTRRKRRADPRPHASPRIISSRRGIGCQDAHAVARSILSTRTDAHGGERYIVTEPVSSGQARQMAAQIIVENVIRESGDSAVEARSALTMVKRQCPPSCRDS